MQRYSVALVLLYSVALSGVCSGPPEPPESACVTKVSPELPLWIVSIPQGSLRDLSRYDVEDHLVDNLRLAFKKLDEDDVSVDSIGYYWLHHRPRCNLFPISDRTIDVTQPEGYGELPSCFKDANTLRHAAAAIGEVYRVPLPDLDDRKDEIGNLEADVADLQESLSVTSEELENERLAARDSAAAEAAAIEALATCRADNQALKMAQSHPAAVVVALDRLDVGLLSLAEAQVSLAGPDTVYISSITYDGRTYSGLLQYRGGTAFAVEAVFDSSKKLFPDSLDLAQTELALIEPDLLDISYVAVGDQGYSGGLRYVGDNRFEVAEIRQVALPPTPAEELSALRAEVISLRAEAQRAWTEVARMQAVIDDLQGASSSAR